MGQGIRSKGAFTYATLRYKETKPPCYNNPKECPDFSLCKKCANLQGCKLCDACEYQGMEWRPCDTYEVCVFRSKGA